MVILFAGYRPALVRSFKIEVLQAMLKFFGHNRGKLYCTLKRSGRLSRGKQWSRAHRGLSSILQNEQHPRHRVALNFYSTH